MAVTRPQCGFLSLVKAGFVAAILLGALGHLLYETHIEFSFYHRGWVQRAVEPVAPLSDCFAPDRVSPRYNASAHVWGPKRGAVMSGLSLRLGLDCYEFAGTLQPTTATRHADQRPEADSPPLPEEQRTRFHTYWRADLAPFGQRQGYMLRSFFATQPLSTSHLTLWSNDGAKLARHPLLRLYLGQFPASFAVRTADYAELSKGTGLDSRLGMMHDTRGWVDSDLLRLLFLWNFGGIWVDMDSVLTRDLSPLLDHEFVTQWDCYDKIYKPFNGALLHFLQHSPYLCEAFHVISQSPLPRLGTTDLGAVLYLQLWRRLVHAEIPPFAVLPFCFNDGRSCRLDNRLPDPFLPDRRDRWWTGMEEGGALDDVLGKVFAVHLHNQWDKTFPEDGWAKRLLLERHEKRVEKLVAGVLS